MFNQTLLLKKVPIAALALEERQFGVDHMVHFFYKASHQKKKGMAGHFIRQLEIQLERFNQHQQLQGGLCETLEKQWKVKLDNVCAAVQLFEQNYKANCPVAGVLPSPLIRRLKSIERKAKLALFYIEV